MKPRTFPLTLTAQALALAAFAAAPIAAADEPPAGAGAPGGQQGDDQGQNGQGGPSITVVPVPAPYPGNLPPPSFDPNGHLPSSSRAVGDINKGDSFDLRHVGEGPASVHGSAGGSYVVEGQFAPEAHTVRRGDTLWEISARYYQNPYTWPRVWSYNPQIQNPHWIYPGDHVRLREPGTATQGQAMLGLSQGRGAVPPQTVFLRDVGWVDDKKDDDWGELIGSPADKMLLSEGDETYLQLDDARQVQVGDELTVFRPIRTVESENASGEFVSIRGTVRVDRYNPKTHMARARVIEAVDVIERGVRIGPVGRKFDVVPPVPSDVDLDATILASVYPHQVFGQNQVVFIDRGAKEGVKPGQRFFAIRRGDRWAQNVGGAGYLADKRPRVEDDRPARIDPMRYGVDADLLPDETYAELRVVRVRDHTAAALVVAARHEIERNARLVTRKGM
jgi:LysM repeat protein